MSWKLSSSACCGSSSSYTFYFNIIKIIWNFCENVRATEEFGGVKNKICYKENLLYFRLMCVPLNPHYYYHPSYRCELIHTVLYHPAWWWFYYYFPYFSFVHSLILCQMKNCYGTIFFLHQSFKIVIITVNVINEMVSSINIVIAHKVIIIKNCGFVFLSTYR